MKKVIWYCLFFLSIPVWAQQTNLVIFSEEGEKFQLIVNGAIQNPEPLTQVVVTGLKPMAYRVKVKFVNTQLGEASRTLPLEGGLEYSFVVRKKKTNTAVGGYFKEVGESLDKNLGTDMSKEENNPGESYVIRYLSQTPLLSGDYSGTHFTPSNSGSSNTSGASTPATPGSGAPGEGINMSINASDEGFNMNMSVSGTGTGFTQTTTTTTTNTNSTYSDQGAVYTPPASSSTTTTSTRCSAPMANGNFQAAKNSISSKGFDETRLQIAKQVAGSNCLSVGQIKEVMEIFGFEETKLGFAKFAYDRCSDPQNYFMINDVFGFSSSTDDLNEYIQSKGR